MILSCSLLFLAALPVFGIDEESLSKKKSVAKQLKAIKAGFKLSETSPPYHLVSYDSTTACSKDLGTNCFKVETTLKDYANTDGTFTPRFKYHVDADTGADDADTKLMSKKSVAVKIGTTSGWKIGAKLTAKGPKDIGGEVSGEYSESTTQETTKTTEVAREINCPKDSSCYIITISYYLGFSGSCTRRPFRYCNKNDGQVDWCKNVGDTFKCQFEKDFHSDNCDGTNYKKIPLCSFLTPVLTNEGEQYTRTISVVEKNSDEGEKARKRQDKDGGGGKPILADDDSRIFGGDADFPGFDEAYDGDGDADVSVEFLD